MWEYRVSKKTDTFDIQIIKSVRFSFTHPVYIAEEEMSSHRGTSPRTVDEIYL
jgi:hypothetical protein